MVGAMEERPRITTRPTPAKVQETSLFDDVIAAARQAPSAHNTQPWEFKAISDTVIDVYVDWSRHLAVSDPTTRQLYVSMGCTLANMVIAGENRGTTAHIAYFPEGTDEQKPAARITYTAQETAVSGETTSIMDAITTRRTDRSDYDAQPLTHEEKTALQSTQDARVTLVEDRRKIDLIGKLTEEGTLDTLSRQDFKEELAQWVRNSWTRQHDGMPGYAMGVPAPMSLLGSFIVRVAPIHKQEGPKTRKQAQSASAIAIIATEHDTPTEWMQAGQLLERIWLEAVAAGLAASPLTAAIEAHNNTRQKLQEALGTTSLPQAILRIGHSAAEQLRPSPRRSAQECLRK